MSLTNRILSRTWVRWLLTAVVAVVVLALPLVLDEYTNQNLARIGVFAVAVLGLNVVMGYTGQVSLGQIFFVGVGAYVTAYGATHHWNIVLVLLALAGIIGPWIHAHPYDRIYPQYVRAPASLEAYPKEEAIIPAFERAAARTRVDVGEIDVAGSVVRAPVSSDEALDPRIALT